MPTLFKLGVRSFGALRADYKCKMQNAECKIIGAKPIIDKVVVMR